MNNFMEVTLASSTTSAPNDSIMSLLFSADLIVQFVLLVLLGMSVVCWAIIWKKGGQLLDATKQSDEFLEDFWSASQQDAAYEATSRFPNSPIAEVFKVGYKDLTRIRRAGQEADAIPMLARSLRRATMVESIKLEHHIIFLATTGATAPFIGLFGTVWGILRAFQKLGNAGAATIQVVGPDIAHALIATAVGLVAAIPAVMAFNYFNAKIRVLNTEMENFSSDYLNLVKRHLK